MTRKELLDEKKKLEEQIRICEIEKVSHKIIDGQRKKLAEVEEKLNEII
tara:strand:- start:349 stop:495 length:147 start_codon:yes stop_codon:yes gene_type:complete